MPKTRVSAFEPRWGDVLTIYSDVTQGGGTVILHIGVWGVEKSNENGDGASIDKLLPVFVWVRMQLVNGGLCAVVVTNLSVSC